MSETKTPLEMATACATYMSERDKAAQSLGIVCESAGSGKAKLSMRVDENMLNAAGTCQGGVVFTLADTAFAFACNSGNVLAVAAGCRIDFLRPAKLGELLTALAEEQELVGRNGVYDVVVRNQDEEAVALFRGKCRRLNRSVLPGPPIA